MKTCTKCANAKTLCEFYNNKASRDGKTAECKECVKEKVRVWREANPERARTKKREWERKNRDAIREKNRIWYLENRDKIRARSKQWYEENLERALESRKRWREENLERKSFTTKAWTQRNLERKKELDKQWRAANRSRRNESERDRYQRIKHLADTRSKIAFRNLLGVTLRAAKSNKTAHTHEMLGYTADELRDHLERQFTKGMTWDNYGDWHIDHIVPISEHIHSGETDPAVVNCLTNLRPMWAKENMRKSDKRTHLL